MSSLIAPSVTDFLPAAHRMQASLLFAPDTGRYVPPEQLLHAVEPAAAEYLPAAQSTHVPALSAPGAVE